jgi:hypothetical protein
MYLEVQHSLIKLIVGFEFCAVVMMFEKLNMAATHISNMPTLLKINFFVILVSVFFVFV